MAPVASSTNASQVDMAGGGGGRSSPASVASNARLDAMELYFPLLDFDRGVYLGFLDWILGLEAGILGLGAIDGCRAVGWGASSVLEVVSTLAGRVGRPGGGRTGLLCLLLGIGTLSVGGAPVDFAGRIGATGGGVAADVISADAPGERTKRGRFFVVATGSCTVGGSSSGARLGGGGRKGAPPSTVLICVGAGRDGFLCPALLVGTNEVSSSDRPKISFM